MNRRDAAIWYANNGWPVFPLAAGNNVPTADSRGHLDATTNIDTIETTWHERARFNIGIPTGPAGLVIIDIDPRHGGDEALSDLCGRFTPFPETPIVLTPSGGCHYYFRAPSATTIGNSASAIGPGIDVRGSGGYVAVPPSRRPDGDYEWEAGCAPWEMPVAGLPGWLCMLLLAAKARRQSTPIGDIIPYHSRNHTLTSLAGSMRRRGACTEAIYAALRVENKMKCNPPLSDREIEKIAESVAHYAPPVWNSGPAKIVPV